MSNNKQPVELTEITVSSPVATQGLTMEDRDASIRLLLNSAERGENRGKQRPPSICKVSRILRDHNESSFEPLLVSIGPIHRKDPKLQAFERQKECYLNDLLNRSHYSTPKETLLEACLLKVNTLIPQIRESYAGVKKKYSDGELARMMVMDGCFILEFCFKHDGKNLLQNKMQNLRIAMDLMLLENQVPFVVLQALFDCLIPYISKKKVPLTLSQVLDTYLAPYIKLFRSDLSPEKISTTDADSNSTHDHVLGYLHTRYQLVVAKSSNREERIENTAFPSMVELDRSGVKFKPHQENVWSMTIKFQPYLFVTTGTLLMPTLVIDDMTELILRNFIAYEQSFPQVRYYFTSYARAMDMLIDSQEDIAKLVKSKVLVNTLASNQEAADMIKKMCKNICFDDFYYNHEFIQMDKYYNSYWPNQTAFLRRSYFTNPWNILQLLNAIFLLCIAVVQTIFTIRTSKYGSNQSI